MRNYISIIVLAALLCGCQKSGITPTIRTCASMPESRASACACVLDGKAYVFGGRDASGNFRNDLWAYDSASDTWTDLGTTPLKARVNATITAACGRLYAGLGYSSAEAYLDTAYMKDWWTYSPATAQWTQLADFPSANTVAASSFTLDGDIYILYGFGHGFTNDICRYNINTGTWTYIDDNSERARANFGGRGAICDRRLFFGLGFNTHNLTQWYEADLQSDTWQKKRPIPGKGREFAACAATDEYVYVMGGRYFGGDMSGGEVFDTYLRYSSHDDQWTSCGAMPCGRAENQVAFCLNGKVYFGLGEDETGKVHNTLYCIE